MGRSLGDLRPTARWRHAGARALCSRNHASLVPAPALRPVGVNKMVSDRVALAGFLAMVLCNASLLGLLFSRSHPTHLAPPERLVGENGRCELCLTGLAWVHLVAGHFQTHACFARVIAYLDNLQGPAAVEQHRRITGKERGSAAVRAPRGGKLQSGQITNQIMLHGPSIRPRFPNWMSSPAGRWSRHRAQVARGEWAGGGGVALPMSTTYARGASHGWPASCRACRRQKSKKMIPPWGLG